MMRFEKIKDFNGFWLVFLRISVPLLCLAEIFSIWKDFEIFYSDEGLVNLDIVNAYTDRNSLTLFDLFNFLKGKLGFSVSYINYLQLVLFLYCIILILVILGLYTKLNTLLCIVFQLLISKSYPDIQTGYDYFTTLCFFYIFAFPTNIYFSLDEKLKIKKIFLVNEKYSLIIIKIHVCIMYFFAGFDKTLGQNWRNGESMWRVLTEYNVTSLYNFKKLSSTLFSM